MWSRTGSAEVPERVREILTITSESNYNRANEPCVRVAGRVCVCVCCNRLLERLMSPSPTSQVMFASAFS